MVKIDGVSNRRQARFFREADYFVVRCGWDINEIALGFVLACDVPQGRATAVAHQLVSAYTAYQRKAIVREKL